MNDEQEMLYQVQPSTARETAARGVQVVHEARVPLFRTGSQVRYKGEVCTVNHVLISRGHLMVSLNEHQRPVDADELSLPPTRLTLKRNRSL